MEQLKVFHQASYKFTRRDKATRMFYLERTVEEVMSKSTFSRAYDNRRFTLKISTDRLHHRWGWDDSGQCNVRQASPNTI
jgi:hypothetical protein